ncbi:MAG: exodeoxyribonuclease V subunit gamma, partial [Deltaproteobacteria bacterium]
MPLSMPLDKEIIVVQSRGMERWLSLRLAEIHGICANYEFPFPNSFLNRMFGLLVPEYTYSEMFEPDTMTWEIIGLLPKVIDMDAFGSVKAYLADDIQGLKVYQLARHIADRFDQYMVYRPEMILDWEKGLTHLGEEEKDVETWQAILFRNMLKDTGGMSRVSLLRLFMERVKKVQGHRGLPERVSIFGISSLPRYHMEALMALSSQVEVNLFLMSPAKEFWGDIVSDMEMVRLKRKEARSAKELFLEKGNTLLASMGIVGRDFLDLVYGYDLEEFRLFEDVEEESLLSFVQSDILNLRESNEQKRPFSKDDRSIQVHSCHSPMREIEVLFDNLLEMFDEDPGLEPRDILVMAPDIEKYVPYIQAVFSTPEDDSLYIPYSIADRPIKMQSQLLGSFFDILDLPRSRLKASDVLNLLEFPCIRRRFNIQDADLDIIRKWVRASGIRWGLDADFRKALGLPGFEENTWSYGIKRLLLGY